MKGREQVKKQSKHRWKVIKKDTRTSIIINKRSPFCLTYLPDTIVTAPKGTIGIMTFETKGDADWWWKNRHSDYLIIKVIPIGRGHRPKLISSDVLTRLLRLFYKKGECRNMKPPVGTICYPAVQVIE